jgi:hypothetical protein
MRLLARRIIPIVLVLVALTLAGCGGGNDGATQRNPLDDGRSANTGVGPAGTLADDGSDESASAQNSGADDSSGSAAAVVMLLVVVGVAGVALIAVKRRRSKSAAGRAAT